MKKGASTTFIVFIIVLVIVVVAVIWVFIRPSMSNISGNVINDLNSAGADALQKNCKDVQVPYDYIEEYQETVPYSDRVCETKELVYSVTNEKWNYATCNSMSKKCDGNFLGVPTDCTNFCEDKTLSYSVDVNNLDEEQGSFTVNINFYKDGSLYKTVPLNQFLYPKTTETFNGVIKVTGDSPSGDANQDYSASYSLQYIPTKQVCRDVTNYKEVTKTRTVTRYRTDTQCD